jgi:lysozyme family protein
VSTATKVGTYRDSMRSCADWIAAAALAELRGFAGFGTVSH